MTKEEALKQAREEYSAIDLFEYAFNAGVEWMEQKDDEPKNVVCENKKCYPAEDYYKMKKSAASKVFSRPIPDHIKEGVDRGIDAYYQKKVASIHEWIEKRDRSDCGTSGQELYIMTKCDVKLLKALIQELL